jgi:multidrug transporter EmrE-like cation transporter
MHGACQARACWTGLRRSPWVPCGIVVLISIAFFGERLTFPQVLGAAAILAGVALLAVTETGES